MTRSCAFLSLGMLDNSMSIVRVSPPSPSHNHTKNIYIGSSQQSNKAWKHLQKFSVIAIWNKCRDISQMLVLKHTLSFSRNFLNSNTLLNSCLNLKDCDVACASTENTAKNSNMTRLLELHVTHPRWFLSKIPQILSVLPDKNSSVLVYSFKSCIILCHFLVFYML